jgi:hypothetical protein
LVVDSAPSRPNRTRRRKPSATATTARSSSSTVQYLAPDGNLTRNARMLSFPDLVLGPSTTTSHKPHTRGDPPQNRCQPPVQATSCSGPLIPGEGVRIEELLELTHHSLKV